MKEVNRRVVFGKMPSDFAPAADDATETVYARSFDDVHRHLWKASHVELVVAERDIVVGKWRRVAELIAQNTAGRLQIIGNDGREVFRCALARPQLTRPGSVSSSENATWKV